MVYLLKSYQKALYSVK